MSGGSYNYGYSTIEYEYANRMYDVELNEMMMDLSKVLHDLEWWQSGDIGEEEYRKTVAGFKKKWFKRTKTNVKALIESEFENKKQDLLRDLGYMIKD